MFPDDTPFELKLDAPTASKNDIRVRLKGVEDAMLLLIARQMTRALLQDEVERGASSKRQPIA